MVFREIRQVMVRNRRSRRGGRCAASRVTLVLTLVLAASALQAADWPEWGGGGARNMASPETSLPTGLESAEKLWAVRLGSQTYGTPAVAGGKVVVGTNDSSLKDDRLRRSRGGLVVCLAEKTGALLWQLPIPRLKSMSATCVDHMNLGVCSPPTVAGDRVYLVSNRCEVLCLDIHGQANGNDGPFQAEGQYMAGPDQPGASWAKRARRGAAWVLSARWVRQTVVGPEGRAEPPTEIAQMANGRCRRVTGTRRAPKVLRATGRCLRHRPACSKKTLHTVRRSVGGKRLSSGGFGG